MCIVDIAVDSPDREPSCIVGMDPVAAAAAAVAAAAAAVDVVVADDGGTRLRHFLPKEKMVQKVMSKELIFV